MGLNISIVIDKIDKLEYGAIKKNLHLKGLRGKQIYDDMFNTLGDKCPSYTSVKNLMACFKRAPKISMQFTLSDHGIGLKRISEDFI